MNKLDVLQRGYDSSGRPLKATRFAWQFYDRVNERLGGKLVIVQGGFMSGSGASASAGTHDLAGCFDIRTWNLTASERSLALHEGRRLGGATWYRTEAQGFDPHFHWVIGGDKPMASSAKAQWDMYLKGYNGLGSYSYRDDFPYRPSPIREYQYLEEDDMFSEQDSERLKRVESTLKEFKDAEWKRDKNDRIQDKERFSKLVDALGKAADALGVVENSLKDDASKQDVRRAKKQILEVLRNDPDVDGVDNPA